MSNPLKPLDGAVNRTLRYAHDCAVTNRRYPLWL